MTTQHDDLEELAFAVSHDIAAPARQIGAFAKLALRNLDDDPVAAKRFLELVVQGSEQLHTMLDALLFYSRIERLGGPTEPVDVEMLVSVALEDLHDGTGEQATIRFTGGPMIHAEPTQLRRVVTEAVANILHHAGPGAQGEVFVEEDADKWTLHVVDDGKGIPADRHADALRLFRKVDHSTKTRVGAGLGLIRRVAKHHGGDAAFTPTESGTRLHITFSKRQGEP